VVNVVVGCAGAGGGFLLFLALPWIDYVDNIKDAPDLTPGRLFSICLPLAFAGVLAVISGVSLFFPSEGAGLLAVVLLVLAVVLSLIFCVLGWAMLNWFVLPVGLVAVLAIAEMFYLGASLGSARRVGR